MMNSIVEQFNSVLTGCSLKATPAPSKNDAPINLGTEEYESRARVLARRAEKLRQAAAESEQLAREFKLQAQQSALKKSSRAKMPIPHNCGLFAYFSSVNFSGSLYISIMGVLLPALATYLSPQLFDTADELVQRNHLHGSILLFSCRDYWRRQVSHPVL